MINDILKKVEQYNTIIILRHRNPDPDAIGSQTGLAAILQEVFPQKDIYVTGIDLPVLNWIGQMQDIPDSTFKDALVITVDTANARRIDNDGAYKQAAEIIKIDHHPNVDPFGDMNWVDDTFSSCAEMIFSFTEEIAEFDLTKEIAAKLYSGIIGDTVRFLNGETSYRTLITSAKLAKTGINISKISLQEDQMSLQVARLEAYILDNLQITDSGFGYIVIRKDTLDQFHLDDGELDHAVPLIGRIDKVKTWIVVSEKDLNRFRVNLRSKSISINGMAEKYGGGGHPLASGVYVGSIEKVNKLINDMDNFNKKELKI